MPGLPAGAAQAHSVPLRLRCYEHVMGIEFIEVDPNVPAPLSAAYRPVSGGAQMLIRRETPELEERSLSEDEARQLIGALDEAGLFEWQRVYCPAQGTYRVVATEWRIQVTFDEKISRHSSSFQSEGEDEFPDTYDSVVGILVHEPVKTVEISE